MAPSTRAASACAAITLPIFDANLSQAVTDRDWAILCAEIANDVFLDTGVGGDKMCSPIWDMVASDTPAVSCKLTDRNAACEEVQTATGVDVARRCDAVDAIVWASTPAFIGDNSAPSVVDVPRCLMVSNTCTTVQRSTEPAVCEALKEEAGSADTLDQLAKINNCAMATVADETHTCVYNGIATPKGYPYCNEILKTTATECTSDHLNRLDLNCLGPYAGALKDLDDFMDGAPRCTYDGTRAATSYPQWEESNDTTGLYPHVSFQYPCFKSMCNTVKSDPGYNSFADYLAACQAASMVDVTDGYCLPRITGHDFTTGTLDGYCFVETNPVCNNFLSADSCRYATFSVLSGASNYDPKYPVCEWSADGTVCNVPNASYAGACSEANIKNDSVLNDAVTNATATDVETFEFCANVGGSPRCIPRGAVEYFHSPTVSADGVPQYCIKLSEEEFDDVDALCSMPMMETPEFCNAGRRCEWDILDGLCRSVPELVNETPGSSPCSMTKIEDATANAVAFASYAEHLDFCSNQDAWGVCLPAEDMIDYAGPSWNTTAQYACRDWSEKLLQCDRFSKQEACDHVDVTVFEIFVDEGPFKFGRRCEWDEKAGPNDPPCKDRVDTCSQITSSITAQDPYSSLVDLCATENPAVDDVDAPLPILCVPELQDLSSDPTRNTCQLEVLTCESYIAQTEQNCEEEDLLFARRTCSWDYQLRECNDYVLSECEKTTFPIDPTDYKSFYDKCYTHTKSNEGRFCLPVHSVAGDGSETFGCDLFKPREISCATFGVTADLSQDACAIADSQVYSYTKPEGGIGMFGLRCEYTTGQCTDRTGECMNIDASNEVDLFGVADTCKKSSTGSELCWPMLESYQTGDAMEFNVCDLGRQDGADIRCSTPELFLNDAQCVAATQWFEENTFFPELEYCNFVTKADGAQVEGCKYDLPSDETGCGKATFATVPESYEEYFDLCSGKQMETPYSQDKECIPLLPSLVDATADRVKCKAVFGPVKCENFSSEGNGDEDMEYCRAANRHIFTADVNDTMNSYGISCYPETEEGIGGVSCKELSDVCHTVRYNHNTDYGTTEEPLEAETTETQSYEWKLYNAECMSNDAQPDQDAEPDLLSLPNYCMAEIMYVNEDAEYNTCSFVGSEELNCSLPRFQSQEACDTMKELEITKVDATDDGKFKLGCTWVPEPGTGTGRCKSGMAKLIVPALMVLVSLLF